MEKDTLLSFIIPTLNEEKNIANCINSISRAMHNTPYEIIISDNGSNDKTREIASKIGAIVVIDTKATIGGLRNLGAKTSKGHILIFIDADVCISFDWLEQLKLALITWPNDNLIVTGSTCLTPYSDTFIERNWFSKLSDTGTNYINSGHLITSRVMFNTILGFDSTLKTAEDYDFCQRAAKAGGKIIKAPKIKAFHHGYPSSIIQFISRESWHGKEDFSSFKKFINSKTAIAAIINSSILFLSITLYVLNQEWLISLLLFSASIILCLTLSILKFGKSKPIDIIKTSLCFQLYLMGRTISLLSGDKRPASRR